MDEEVPTAKRALFDWGGWLRGNYWSVDDRVDRDFDGSDDGRHAYRQQQLRLWGHFNLDQVHQFYGRMRLDYIDWNHGSSYDRNDSDWEGPDLERGWYDFRLSRYQLAYGQSPGDFDLAVRLGRQYVQLGTGLALSVPLDAVVASTYYQDWQMTGMMALSIPSTDNIDRSVPGDSKESRRYWAVQLNYHAWRDHEPFVYFFSQEDKDAGIIRDDQTFGYDSMYAGIGSRGRFFHRDLQYTGEFVVECGKSYADALNESHRQNIHAWAFDTEIRYVIPDEHDSQLSVEYLLASGDSDRIASPTNTVGGNLPHSKDTSFVGWGYRNTGLSLAPRMSNLGMVRLGASTFPANQISFFREMQVGTNFYLYHKQQAAGAASDSLSTKDKHYLGSEIDIYVNWRITPDLAWALRYGIFLPGDAFSRQSHRELFFTALTFNF